MIQFVKNSCVGMLVIAGIVPNISGGHFHGHFWMTGVVLGICLATIMVVQRFFLTCIFEILQKISSLWAMVLFVPCYAVIPVTALRVLAHFAPAYLSFDSWGCAIVCSFAFLAADYFFFKLEEVY